MCIVIIGFGIVGLVSVWWLDGEYEVMLFEVNDYLGGYIYIYDM